MKKLFLMILFSLANVVVFSQIEYGYERPKSSTDPWKFGINVNVSRDWINQTNGINKDIGWKAGICGEKHLVYNIYFRPILNFVSKGYTYEEELTARNEINAYLMDLELTFEMKFGDERRGRGFLCYFAPFFTYGIGGTSKFTNKTPYDSEGNIPNNYLIEQEYKTFGENSVKKEDIGFLFGVGYDFNHNLELNVYYAMGFLNIGSYNNFRWRNYSIGLTYFFKTNKRH